MTPTITAVQVVFVDAAPGDDTAFVATRAAGDTGWYGPVSAEVGRYVQRVLVPTVIGGSAVDHRGLHSSLRRAVAHDTSVMASWAVGAVDCALWDLHGRLAQQPVAALLGGSARSVVSLYASWLSLDLARPGAQDDLQRVARDGWAFTKWGLRRRAGEPARTAADRLANTTRTVMATIDKVAAFDAVFTWDAPLALMVAEQIDSAEVLWLEDPLPNDDLSTYQSLIGKAPWAVGERLYVHASGDALLALRPRAFTLDVVACGGLTRAVELVSMAAGQGSLVYPHGRSFTPAVHLAAAYPEVIPAVEYRLQWEPVRQQQYAAPWRPEDGAIAIPSSPGLGTAPRSR